MNIWTEGRTGRTTGFAFGPVPLIDTIERIPGGLVLVAMALGSLFRTFCPAVLDAGGFITAMTSASDAYMGVLLFCTGVMVDLRHGPRLLKRGALLNGVKFGLGMAIGYVATRFGPLFGLSGIAVTAALTNTNGMLAMALINRYGDPEDVAGLALRYIAMGPLLPLLVLGAAGQVTGLGRSVAVALAPLIAGMLFGWLDPTSVKLFGPVVTGLVPLSMFAVGSRINLTTIFSAGLAGVVLAVVTVLTGGFVGILVDRWTGGNGVAGATLASTAGNAVLVPASVAAVVPTITRATVSAATAQVATASVLTALITPLLASRVAQGKVRSGR